MQYFVVEAAGKPVAIFLAADLDEAARIADGKRPGREDFRRQLIARQYGAIHIRPTTRAEIELFEKRVTDAWLECERAGIIGRYDKKTFVHWLEPFAPAKREAATRA
jgi:hypothetical protein